MPKINKKVDEAIEILDAIGHENEKEGIKWTQYFMKKFEKDEWQRNQLKKEKLKRKRKFSKMGYFQALSGMLQEEAQDLDLPAGYYAWSEFSLKGVVIKLKDREGLEYYRAFKPEGVPEVDYQAVVKLLVDVLDEVDKIEMKRVNRVRELGLVI